MNSVRCRSDEARQLLLFKADRDPAPTRELSQAHVLPTEALGHGLGALPRLSSRGHVQGMLGQQPRLMPSRQGSEQEPDIDGAQQILERRLRGSRASQWAAEWGHSPAPRKVHPTATQAAA